MYDSGINSTTEKNGSRREAIQLATASRVASW
jgi:hypothetical protein